MAVSLHEIGKNIVYRHTVEKERPYLYIDIYFSKSSIKK